MTAKQAYLQGFLTKLAAAMPADPQMLADVVKSVRAAMFRNPLRKLQLPQGPMANETYNSWLIRRAKQVAAETPVK